MVTLAVVVDVTYRSNGYVRCGCQRGVSLQCMVMLAVVVSVDVLLQCMVKLAVLQWLH